MGGQSPGTQRFQAQIHRGDGTTEQVPVDIPDGFYMPNLDELHHYNMSGWQQCDDVHPPDAGAPGYRVAYKTLKVVPSKDVNLVWPNLRVRFHVGKLNRGGVRTPDGMAGRRPDEQIVPEYGMRLIAEDGSARYLGCPDRRMTFAAWEEDLGGLSYIEVIYILPEGSPAEAAEVRRIGRAAVTPVKTMIDLLYGPRLLGLPLLEEIGEVFDDWHWNRRLDSARLATELQLQADVIQAEEFAHRLGTAMETNQSLDATERQRFRLAAQWYWLADAEPDHVNRFIQMWLVIESLEMESTDIAPVKHRLAALMGSNIGTGAFVGRLYGVRGKLVHGKSTDVSEDELARCETLARLLLLSRVGSNALERYTGRIRTWMS